MLNRPAKPGYATIALGFALAISPGSVAAGECLEEPIERHAVTRITDGNTLLLATGQEVRLKGILLPLGRDFGNAVSPNTAPQWAPERDARDALDRLISSNTIDISSSPRSIDRYGRWVADAGAPAEGGRIWLQGALVSQGHARVTFELDGPNTCGPELLARERGAREARRGLWANPAYAVRNARNTRELLTQTGAFQIVEGQVKAVAQTKTRIYLNFGDNWRWDFTASLPFRKTIDRKSLIARLQTLKDRHVRVRGWIERRNGPWIELSSEAEIEILDRLSE